MNNFRIQGKHFSIAVASVWCLLTVSAIVALNGCASKTPEQKVYEQSLNEERKGKDAEFKNDPSSPFHGEGSVPFTGLKYYEPDLKYVVKSTLTLFEKADTVSVYGTKGEERKAFKIGYMKFSIDDVALQLTVYKSISRSGQEYYSLWFTDKTTGDETYGVGRYIDFEYNPDPGFVYTIDFNKAYNPYCAYNSRYSCAIPTKDNYLAVAITAGEKIYMEH